MAKENVIDFKPKKKVFKLEFRCPPVLEIIKKSGDDVVLEISDGKGVAWVPASSKLDAKKKLHTILKVTEWIND